MASISGDWSGKITIPKALLPKLDLALDKLNQKLEKQGLDNFISSRIDHEYTKQVPIEDGSSLMAERHFVDLEVTTPFDDFSINDRFILKGIIKRDKFNAITVYSTSPSYDIHKHAGDFSRCDHCHTNRKRSMVYVFEVEGKDTVIGSTCAKDYFGINVESFLKTAVSTIKELSELGNKIRFDHDGSESFALKLICSYYQLREDGKYRSGKYHSVSTANDVDTLYWLSRNGDIRESAQFYRDPIEELASKEAANIEEVVNYWESLDPQTDFEYNVREVYLKRSPRSTALIAYGIWHVLKDRIEVKTQRPQKLNEHLRVNVGDRVSSFPLIIEKVVELENGSYDLVVFSDELGRSVKWFTSATKGFREGEKINADFTVKRFSEYKGQKETIVNRVKIV